jgi:hypothetical protein
MCAVADDPCAAAVAGSAGSLLNESTTGADEHPCADGFTAVARKKRVSPSSGNPTAKLYHQETKDSKVRSEEFFITLGSAEECPQEISLSSSFPQI